MSLTDGLISYWKLDESSGVREDSVGTVDLDDINTVTATSDGKIVNAAVMDQANNEYLQATDASQLNISGNSSFAITGWIRLNLKLTPKAIIAKWNANGGDPQRQYALIWDNTIDRFQFLVSSDGTTLSSVTANSFGAPATEIFYFFYVEHDAINDLIRISINDGTVDTTSHTTGIFSSTTLFRIGALQGGAGEDAFQMTGDLDEIGFWNRVLTPEEVSLLYNNGDANGYDNSFSGGFDVDPSELRDADRLFLFS